MEPFISIVIPALNEEKYIEATLKALKNQNFKGKSEIIVVDGMSKDNTVKISKKYTNKVIISKKRGIGTARNAGAKIANGNILLFVDADTIPLYNALSEISKQFKKKNIVGAGFPVVALSPEFKDFIIYWMYNFFMKITIKYGNPQIPGFCCAYRKDIFDKIGGFDENIETWEDYDLSSRISKHGKTVCLENTLVFTSPRRFEKWGRIKAIFMYLGFHLKYLLTGKGPSVKIYKPIR